MDDLPVLDEGALHRLDEWGGRKLRHQMVRLYLENARTRLEQLQGGMSAEDGLDQVEMASHSLKSSAANVGLMRVSVIAARIEDAASRGQMSDLPDLRSQLEAVAREGEDALRLHLAEEEG